jgi:hypothetical protein
MKKRDIWISVAIIVASVLFLFLYFQRKGRIEVNAGVADATLRIRGGWFSGEMLIKSQDCPVTMPARIYKPKRLSLSTKRGGDTWLLYSNGPWGTLSTIRVKGNDTKVLKLGPPFQIKPYVHHNGTYVSMNFNLVGKAGEHYGGAVMRNNKRVAAPKVKIIDEGGNVLASGTFRYG